MASRSPEGGERLGTRASDPGDGPEAGGEARPARRVGTARAAEDLHAAGRVLASQLQPGDLVLLSGPLGAGKTTLTQGVGAGLEVRGPVTSPTFVLARLYPPRPGAGRGSPGTGLLHVDAYRLADWRQLDDLDLLERAEEVVTVVEWGEGIAEPLAESHLLVRIDRAAGPPVLDGRGVPATPGLDDIDPRAVAVTGVGPRWSAAAVADLCRAMSRVLEEPQA